MKVVIIGAGVAGLAIGWRLVQAGVAVTILERSQPASGATWASAGMIAVTAELDGAHAVEIEFANHSNRLWPSFAEEIEAQSGRVIGYTRNGSLLLAEDDAALGRLSRRAGAADLEMLDAAQARAHVPMLTGEFSGALWSPKEAQVDSRALGLALAAAFQKAGGTLFPNEAVVRLERRGTKGNERVAVAHTPFGFHPADIFILAAGAWSGLLEAEAAPITPIKGEMIVLTPPAGAAPPVPVVWGNGIYAVPRGQHLMIGATVEAAGFDTQPTAAARDVLRARAESLMPSLAGWSLTDHWAGLRPRAPDGLPLLGPTAVEGLWVAGGQYRNGILFAPAMAQALCDQLTGRSAPIPAFDPRRLKP